MPEMRQAEKRVLARDGRAPAGIDWGRAFSEAAGPIAALDQDGRYVQANAAFCALVGCPYEALVERGGWCAAQSEGADLAAAVLSAMSGTGEDSIELEHRQVRPDGSTALLTLHVGTVHDEQGTERYFLIRAKDITERRTAEVIWEAMFEHSPIGMGLLDLTGRWEKVNPAMCRLLGRSSEDLVGRRFAELTFPGDEQADVAALEDLREGRRKTVTVEKRYRHRDGHPIWLLIRATLLPGPEGAPPRILSHYEDIGERRLADARLAHLALHDPLTGVANRALLADRLEAALNRLSRERGVLAVLYCDLDQLKPVNDRHGHAAGDQLLIAAARALRAAVRPTDTVARVGGDEFVVAAQVSHEQDAEMLRQRLERRLNIAVVVGSRRLRLRATVGVATIADSAGDIVSLLHDADRDMYARKAGRARVKS